ncbi:glycosyltransferase [Lutibacter sp.]|uniref:glycosyltransferase n=1 Tax=Lutibacter sp. TaxID=1925666 RepID=UPI0025BE50B8|nr:glycosyltransferase [Lutibacter sp.]MCF6167277.1 glycosyltransferase [Lutibacter sp.]
MIAYIFIAFIVIICIQFVYYIFIFGSFAFFKNKPTKNHFNQPVSVLICAKNEAENLKKNIPFFTNQNYSIFELVLINDSSSDNTLEVMEQFKNESSISIKIVNITANKQFREGKKQALTQGIKAASYKHLLFSDADCKPLSRNWITEMTSNFNTQHKIILGFGAYRKIKKSILNKFIRFETLLTAIQYFSYAKIGIPYMGVGRNLAYTKSLFFDVNGFAKHMKIKSGDDDLFINQTATKKNTTICYSKDSYTESTPKTTFRSWIQQKRRHISTATYYKPLHKFLLAVFYSSQVLFWVLGIILLLNLYKWSIVGFLIFIRFLFLYITIGFSAKKLNEIDLVLLIPFYEIFLIFTQMFIFIKNLISKPTHW